MSSTNMNKNLILGAVIAIVAFACGVLFSGSPTPELAGTSATGSTFNSAKIAAIAFAPATGSATSTSVYNGDENDRYITSAFSYCGGVGTSKTAYTGAGLATLILQAATTSTAAPASVSNTNLAMFVTVATSTADSSVATSSYAVAAYQRWQAGSYLTFFTNATNTAACTVGVNYVPS